MKLKGGGVILGLVLLEFEIREQSKAWYAEMEKFRFWVIQFGYWRKFMHLHFYADM